MQLLKRTEALVIVDKAVRMMRHLKVSHLVTVPYSVTHVSPSMCSVAQNGSLSSSLWPPSCRVSALTDLSTS